MCSSNIVSTKRGYTCENKNDCGFHLNYHNLAGLGVPHVRKDVIKALLKNPDSVVRLKARMSGKSYKKKAWLNKGEGYKAWTIVVDDDFYNEDLGACPRCGESIIELASGFKCTSEKCSFFIRKDFKGSEISTEQMISLLSGESIMLQCHSQYDKKKKWNEIAWIDKGNLISEKE